MTALVYILLCLIWGSSWIAIKIGLSEASPLQTVSLRFILAWIILTGLAKIRGQRYPRAWRTWVRIGYPGLWMYAIHFALVYFAEQYIESALMAILFASFPFFVAGLSYIRLQERLSPTSWIGMILGFGGVVLITVHQLHTAQDLFLGTLLGIGAAYAAAHGIVLHKKHFVDEDITVSSSIQILLGGVFLVAATLIFEDIGDFNITAAALGSIAYLAIFGTVIAFLSYYWLLRKASATTVSLIAFVTPLVAIIIGVIFFSESLSLGIAIGAAMILSGIVLVVRD